MKVQILILAVLLVALLGCKKDIVSPTEPECLYIEPDTTGWGYTPVNFYYNTSKKLVAKAYYEIVCSPLQTLESIPSLDSVVYQPNGNVITYHYRGVLTGSFTTGGSFNRNKMPIHANTPTDKVEYLLDNNRIIKVNYYQGINNQFMSKDSFVYEGDKLVRIYKSGNIKMTNSVKNETFKGEELYTLKYDGNNLASAISIAKNSLGDTLGGNEILYHHFTSLKNPYKMQRYIPHGFFSSLSENICDSSSVAYSYVLKNGGVITDVKAGSSSFTSKIIFTDNGKGYPKELGLYKCD
jgi:hypothetical protein